MLKHFPKFAEAYADRALLRYRAADIDGAIEDARKSVSLKPHLSQIWALLGTLYFRIQNLGGAVESLNNALEGDASNKSYALNLSELLRQDRKTAEAIATLEKAIRYNPRDADLWSAIGVAFQEEGQTESAKEAYEKAVAIQPKSAVALSNLGLLELEAKNWSLAFELLQKSLDINPDSSKTLNNIGLTLKCMGKIFEAESNFKKAIVADPSNAEAYNNLGRSYEGYRKFEEAEKYYRKAILIRPDAAEIYLNLGNTLLELNRIDEAEENLMQALSINPQSAKAYNALGVLLQKAGKPEESRKSLTQAVALESKFAEAFSNLGNTLIDLGRLEEAEKSFIKAISLQPDSSVVRMNFGNLLQELCRFQDSQEICTRIIAKRPTAISSYAKPKLTCLLSHGRSGSLFFHSLFDGHPELSTLPGVFFKGWFSPLSWQRFELFLDQSAWREALVSALIDEYEPLFNSNSKKNVFGKPLGDANWLARDSGFTSMGLSGTDAFILDQEAFSKTLLSLLLPIESITDVQLFESVHRAFDIAIRGRNKALSEPNDRIFYHLHNPSVADRLNFANCYPEARFILLTRNPIQSLESWILFELGTAKVGTLTIKLWNTIVTKIINIFLTTRVSAADSTQFRGVKLEDVKNRPSDVMPQIAAWIEISDHPSLYNSTFCGMKYWSPSSTGNEAISGFDPQAIEYPNGRFFAKNEIHILETLLWPFLKLYGYTTMDEAEFRINLPKIDSWLNEPLEFEKKFYDALPMPAPHLQAQGPYKRLRHFLNLQCSMLKSEGIYEAIVKPLELN